MCVRQRITLTLWAAGTFNGKVVNLGDAAPLQVVQEVVWRTCSQLRGVPEPDVHWK